MSLTSFAGKQLRADFASSSRKLPFPSNLNMPWEGRPVSQEYLRHIVRISHGGKQPGKGGGDLDVTLWVEDPDQFRAHYERSRTTSIAGMDIEEFPKNPKLTIRSLKEIPETYPVDKILGHFRRVMRMSSGRNNAVGAADIAKAQLLDYVGGIVSDIRTCLPKPVMKIILSKMVKEFCFSKRRMIDSPCIYAEVEHFPIQKTYKELDYSSRDLLNYPLGFSADFAIARPSTDETNKVKEHLAARLLIACQQKAITPTQNSEEMELTAVKKGIKDFNSFTHLLKILYGFDQKKNLISRFDQQRLPHMGACSDELFSLTPEEQRLNVTTNQTGQFLHDATSLLSPGEKKEIETTTEELTKNSLGDLKLSDSKAKWQYRLPTNRVQDDLNVIYTTMQHTKL
jgi:hypothetical protein